MQHQLCALNAFMLHVPCLISHDRRQGVALGELCLLGHRNETSVWDKFWLRVWPFI